MKYLLLCGLILGLSACSDPGEIAYLQWNTFNTNKCFAMRGKAFISKEKEVYEYICYDKDRVMFKDTFTKEK